MQKLGVVFADRRQLLLHDAKCCKICADYLHYVGVGTVPTLCGRPPTYTCVAQRYDPNLSSALGKVNVNFGQFLFLCTCLSYEPVRITRRADGQDS